MGRAAAAVGLAVLSPSRIDLRHASDELALRHGDQDLASAADRADALDRTGDRARNSLRSNHAGLQDPPCERRRSSQSRNSSIMLSGMPRATTCSTAAARSAGVEA